jgi:hypothetical protein
MYNILTYLFQAQDIVDEILHAKGEGGGRRAPYE